MPVIQITETKKVYVIHLEDIKCVNAITINQKAFS
jgi:hypothetical protein